MVSSLCHNLVEMKTIILAICLVGALLIQGCVAYVEPVGGFYFRENIWFYKDGRGGEHRENGRYHHRPEDEHHDEQRR
jgi:hypothetical protein